MSLHVFLCRASACARAQQDGHASKRRLLPRLPPLGADGGGTDRGQKQLKHSNTCAAVCSAKVPCVRKQRPHTGRQ
jgi:hypothetical protein